MSVFFLSQMALDTDPSILAYVVAATRVFLIFMTPQNFLTVCYRTGR
jgi:hypothetical protein